MKLENGGCLEEETRSYHIWEASFPARNCSYIFFDQRCTSAQSKKGAPFQFVKSAPERSPSRRQVPSSSGSYRSLTAVDMRNTTFVTSLITGVLYTLFHAVAERCSLSYESAPKCTFFQNWKASFTADAAAPFNSSSDAKDAAKTPIGIRANLRKSQPTKTPLF